MKTLFCLSALLLLTAPTFSQSEAYKKKLKTMFEVSGSEHTFKIVVTRMVDNFKGIKTDVPANIWDEIESELLKTSLEELTEVLVPVYYRHLSEQDLDDIITFYLSPAGLKLSEKTPTITAESMDAGQEWGRKVGEELGKKIAERGY